MINDIPDYNEGVRNITIGNIIVPVYCDSEGYTVIQSRGQFGNPEDFFYRDWADYLKPFGTPGKEFWLGLENIYVMTNKKKYKLKIEAKDYEGNTDQAIWNDFRLTESVMTRQMTQ